MLKNKSLFLIVLAGAAGCALKQQAVFVDLDRVARSEKLPAPVVLPKPVPAPSFGSSTLSFPAMPATVFRLGSDKQRVQEVQRVLALSREQAYTQISSRLKDAYYAAIQSAQTLALTNLSKANLDQYNRANAAAYVKFQPYAVKRGHLETLLVLAAGFPDPDPASQKPPPKNGTVAYNQYVKAKSIRSQISALDQSYLAERNAIFAQTGIDVQQARKNVEADFERQRAAADKRAEAEAQAQVVRAQETLRTVLADNSVVAFPAEAGHTVTVSGATPPPAPPAVAQPGEAALQQQMRATDLSDLKIWAALHSYVISSSPRGARDATDDFIQWKKAHLATR